METRPLPVRRPEMRRENKAAQSGTRHWGGTYVKPATTSCLSSAGSTVPHVGVLLGRVSSSDRCQGNPNHCDFGFLCIGTNKLTEHARCARSRNSNKSVCEEGWLERYN